MPSAIKSNPSLVIAGCCSFVGALMHLVCIAGGADWYRWMGAGERIARQVEAGELMPAVLTLLISTLLCGWGLLAFSGAGLIRRLPLLVPGLWVITAVYLLRGVAGFVLPVLVDHPMVQQNSLTFWWTSSLVCCVFGGFYWHGTRQLQRL